MNLSGKKELKIDSSLLSPMKWRCIGPFRGGRVVAVAGDPKDPLVFSLKTKNILANLPTQEMLMGSLYGGHQ